MTPETRLSKKIREAISATWPSAWTMKVHGSEYQPAGTPDIFALVEGTFVGLEVKAPQPGESEEHARGRATRLQLQRIEEIKRAGGYGAVVVSVEEALDTIHEAAIAKRKETRKRK